MDRQDRIQRVAVVMAGGSGERFWPLSRTHRPKQLLHLTSADESMLAEAVARLAPLIPLKHIYIATGAHLVQPIQEAGIGVPPENVIAEPCKRNTGGALAYAASVLLARYGGDGSNISMAITTADHQIGESDLFRRTVDAALTSAENEEVLAIMGIVPSRPETGYGYIQVTDDAPTDRGGIAVYPVKAFHEKPDRERAEEFIATGRYFWNSGMFFWRVSVFLDELRHASPLHAAAVSAMAGARRKGDTDTVRTEFERLEDISIDYALMERARRVHMVRADYPWDDVGAWTALDRTYPKDANGNVAVGDPVLVDCNDCIVYNDSGAKDIALSVVGAENLVVVVTKDAILVIPKDRAQDVREAVKELKERGAGQL